MTIQNKMKPLFATTLMQIVPSTPFERVKIKDLCEACGVDRQVFYYYFHDKYDLAAWVFMDVFERIQKRDTTTTFEQLVCQFLEKVGENTPFWRSLFADKNQLSVAHYIHEFDIVWGSDAVKWATGTSVVGVDLRFSVEYFSHANIDSTIDWIQGKIPLDRKEFARMQYRSMPKELRGAYDAKISRSHTV